MDELIPLSDATLPMLSGEVQVPRYDRSALTPGIVHIGVGNFHRAHQAWYLHRLMQAGLAGDWAVVGSGVRPYDAAMRGKLLAQDCLTTLVELDSGGISAEVVGPMTGYVPIEAENRSLIERMADPAIRIVSLSVTEGGYYIDPASGDLDARHPDIVHDAANPGRPRTAFGAMVAALRRRRDGGLGPFTGLSCDNLQGNGAILRQAVTSLARLGEPDLADWIGDKCSFPNSVVDCIVPATGPEELALVRRLGIGDRAPVAHESYRQWVIEDDFCAGRPDWDRAGAVFSSRVHDYEAMKLRILNAGHQIIANAGELLSLPTIADCMAHPLIDAFFRKVQTEEIIPHVKPVAGMGPSDYLGLVGRRFSNRSIVDTTRRVAFDGSSRHSGFVLPIVRDALSAGAPVEGLALVEALWARMCAGIREDGSTIEPNDPFWAQLGQAARAARERPTAWIEQRQFYGDLAEARRFADSFAQWLSRIWADGCATALSAYTGSSERRQRYTG